MSASVARPTTAPVKTQLVDSLMMTPPTLERLHELLAKVATDVGWAAWTIQPAPSAGYHEPDDEMMQDAEDALFAAYSAVYAYRGGRPS